MSRWASWRSVATAGAALSERIATSRLGVLARRLIGPAQSVDRLAERIATVTAGLEQNRRRPPSPQTTPPPSPASAPPLIAIEAGRFTPALEAISRQARRILRTQRTARFTAAGGRLHPHLDHLKLMDDLGLAQAVEVAACLVDVGEVRPWDFLTRPGDTPARAALLAHVERQGWWRRDRISVWSARLSPSARPGATGPAVAIAHPGREGVLPWETRDDQG